MHTRKKLLRLIEHWLHHQDEHRQTFLKWAGEAEREGLTEVAECLKQVAEDMQLAKTRLEKAKKSIEEVRG